MLRRISKRSFIRADFRELERLRKDLYDLFDEVKEDFLSSGDYELCSGGYLLRIERKSIDTDLLNSIRSGLLSEELRSILNEADIPIFLKEGDMTLRRLASLQGGDPNKEYNQTIALLMGLPGIGQELAERLLKHFGSIENILTAPEEELQKVEGIGSGKAKKIKEFISKRWSEISNSG